MIKLENIYQINISTFILFFGGLSILSSLYMTIPLSKSLEIEFNITTEQAAWAGSMFSIFFSLGCLIVGILSEKIGMRLVMLLGMIGMSIATILTGFSASYASFLFLRAVQGGFAATFSPVALTYVGILFPVEKRRTTIGIISFGFLLAGIIGQLISSTINIHIGWRSVFYLFGGIYFLAVILLVFLPKDVPVKRERIKTTFLNKLSVPFQSKKINVIYCIAVTILMAFVGMYAALGEYLTLNFDFNQKNVFVVRALGIIGILFSPFSGLVSKKMGLTRLLKISLSVSIISLLVLGVSNNLYLIVAFSIFFVGGISLIVPTLITLVGNLSGKNKGIVTSVYTFILFVGASIGPILTALLMSIGTITLPFIVFACMLGVSLVLATRLP
ncbi:MFS transporter [Gracilibacillus sp. HCP3S3_G5_1]